MDDEMQYPESEDEMYNINWETYDDPVFSNTDLLRLPPMLGAAARGDLEEVKRLLEQGRSVNNNDNRGLTALHVSILHQRKEVFDFLLSVEDIRLNVQVFEGDTPLHYAITAKDDHFFTVLMSNPGVYVNMKGSMLRTPLHVAIDANLPHKVRMLLERNADLYAMNLYDEYPLHTACHRHVDVEILYALLYYGADVNFSLNRYRRPIEQALKSFNFEAVDALWDYTFDETRTNRVDLYTASLVMYYYPSRFKDLLQRTKFVEYDEQGLKKLLTLLPFLDSDALESFTKRCSRIVIECLQYAGSFGKWTTRHPQRGFEESIWEATLYRRFVRHFFILCESDAKDAFISALNKVPIFRALRDIVAFGLFPEFTMDTLKQLVMLLASHGLELYVRDMYDLYMPFEFCDLFYMCLFMDLQPTYPHPHPGAPCMGVQLIKGDEKVLSLLIEVPHITIEHFLNADYNSLKKSIMDILAITANPKIQRFILEHGKQEQIYLLNKLPRVPKLVELAREAVRNAIISNPRVTSRSHFYTAVNQLPTYQVIKDIIIYRKKLYLQNPSPRTQRMRLIVK